MIEWIATMMSIAGNIFVNRKNITGLYIWLVGSLIWVIIAIQNFNWAQVALFGVYTILNIEGIIKWRKK
jgi:nicotinamide riboside transporter PnuC